MGRAVIRCGWNDQPERAADAETMGLLPAVSRANSDLRIPGHPRQVAEVEWAP